MPRHGNPPTIITQGEYKGWKAYGPYIREATKRREAQEFYSLRKGDLRKDISRAEYEGSCMDRPPENTKPFLDFIL